VIFIYHRGARIAKLARLLRIPVCYPREGIKITKGRISKLRAPLNWGCGKGVPEDALNKDIHICQSKVRSFEAFAKAQVPHPRWSRNYQELNGLLGSNASIFARQDFLSSGEGIDIIRPEDRRKYEPSGRAAFFVERLPYQREFRVHVWGGQVLVEQIKKLEPGCTNPIHSFTNGATFTACPLDTFLEESVAKLARQLAPKAVAAVGLFFGAVDFFLTKKGNLYVLEVNSAPGIRSEPVEDAYRSALKGLIVSDGSRAYRTAVSRL
jgi:hypothetical protein